MLMLSWVVRRAFFYTPVIKSHLYKHSSIGCTTGTQFTIQYFNKTWVSENYLGTAPESEEPYGPYPIVIKQRSGNNALVVTVNSAMIPGENACVAFITIFDVRLIVMGNIWDYFKLSLMKKE